MILNALKRVWQSSIEIIRTRLEILSLDVKESEIRLIAILIFGIFTVLLLSLGIILGIFMLIVTYWETEPLLIMGILTAALIIGGLVMLVLLILKLKKGRGLFDGIINELDKDLEALGGKVKRLEL